MNVDEIYLNMLMENGVIPEETVDTYMRDDELESLHDDIVTNAARKRLYWQDELVH